MKYSSRLLSSIVSVTAIASAAVAGVQDIPSPFRPGVNCMMNVLRNTPRVAQVESGVIDYLGSPSPFVGYRYTEQDGRVGVVRFVARKVNAQLLALKEDVSNGTVVYWASLNGLTTPGVMPPALGTDSIVTQWKLQCGVLATAVFN
jgi:hypothetical protein